MVAKVRTIARWIDPVSVATVIRTFPGRHTCAPVAVTALADSGLPACLVAAADADTTDAERVNAGMPLSGKTLILTTVGIVAGGPVIWCPRCRQEEICVLSV